MTGKQDSVWLLNSEGQSILGIPFDPQNTDYINFKIEINDETATLETADGVLMTPDEAKAYVATLP
jgi:hypothetical protein